MAMRDSLTIYYDKEETDLGGMIEQLATNREDSRFYKRSKSTIARMLLAEVLEKAIQEEKERKEAAPNLDN